MFCGGGYIGPPGGGYWFCGGGGGANQYISYNLKIINAALCILNKNTRINE